MNGSHFINKSEGLVTVDIPLLTVTVGNKTCVIYGKRFIKMMFVGGITT